MRVVVLGAGFGGLELTTSLCEEVGPDVDIVLIDKSDHFVFGFSKLDVMFGRTETEQVRHFYRDFIKPGVRFVQTTVESIDAKNKRVETGVGTFDADILVVALGADLHPELTPGLLDSGYDFYTEANAFALRDVLGNFDGGRVLVAVTSTPFKCRLRRVRRLCLCTTSSRPAGFAKDHRSRWSCRYLSRSHPLQTPQKRCSLHSPSAGSTGTRT